MNKHYILACALMACSLQGKSTLETVWGVKPSIKDRILEKIETLKNGGNYRTLERRNLTEDQLRVVQCGQKLGDFLYTATKAVGTFVISTTIKDATNKVAKAAENVVGDDSTTAGMVTKSVIQVAGIAAGTYVGNHVCTPVPSADRGSVFPRATGATQVSGSKPVINPPSPSLPTSADLYPNVKFLPTDPTVCAQAPCAENYYRGGSYVYAQSTPTGSLPVIDPTVNAAAQASMDRELKQQGIDMKIGAAVPTAVLSGFPVVSKEIGETIATVAYDVVVNEGPIGSLLFIEAVAQTLRSIGYMLPWG